MKRSSIAALVMGLLVSGIIMRAACDALCSRPGRGRHRSALAGQSAADEVVAISVAILLVILLALGVAWMMVDTSAAGRTLVGSLAILCSSCSGSPGFVRSIRFLSAAAVHPCRRPRLFSCQWLLPNTRADVAPRLARDLFGGRLSADQLDARGHRRACPSMPTRRVCEVTAVVCDIANKHDLAEECSPAQLTEITENSSPTRPSPSCKAGAYIEIGRRRGDRGHFWISGSG